MSENWIEGELKAALDEVYRPAPWLLSSSVAAVRRARPGKRAWTWVAGIAALALAVGSVALFLSIRVSLSSHAHPAGQRATSLPPPTPQTITRTSPSAQVAWLWVQSQGQQPYLVAVDPSGRLVVRFDQSTARGMAGSYGTWRSADGASIFALGSQEVRAYSALDGTVQRTYSRAAGGVVGDAFSPDGRWLAMLLLGADLRLQVIDLRAGSSQILPVGHDPNARLPGMTCSGCAGSVVWGMAVFAPDSVHLYTLTDWGGPLRLTAFSLEGASLTQAATAVDGQQGHAFPSCAGPAMAAKIEAGGRTLVAFCHFGGAVWFFDLGRLTSSGLVQTDQLNPFGLSPIFTPDGQLLYLHQGPGSQNAMQVIDLANHRLLGPVPTPRKPGQDGPFARLITDAYAGGVASTVPVSPDGLRLYAATDDGIMVLRIPDLKPVARLVPGLKVGEVWISGDGQTVYATASDGKRLFVTRADGSDQRSVTLPSTGGGFVASEHG